MRIEIQCTAETYGQVFQWCWENSSEDVEYVPSM